ncbi:MAG TPA: hypothetical protein VMT89_05675 [Candidatus Acidoferrales bacterium]|nr:hypothetical protein [Candidatus Acidoferrales bacterium]
MLIRTQRAVFAAAALAVVASALPVQIMSEDAEIVRGLPADMAQQLARGKEIYVATQRKDGSRSEAVPVWFGLMENAVWFTTSPGSHKAKRIAKGSPVFMSAESKDGPFVKMKAEIIKDGAKAEQLGAIYSKKYWIAWAGFFRPSRARNESGKTILLKLTPAP